MKYLLTPRGWKHELPEDRMDWTLKEEIIFLLSNPQATYKGKKKNREVGFAPWEIAKKVWLHGKIRTVSPDIVRKKLNQLVREGLVTTI